MRLLLLFGDDEGLQGQTRRSKYNENEQTLRYLTSYKRSASDTLFAPALTISVECLSPVCSRLVCRNRLDARTWQTFTSNTSVTMHRSSHSLTVSTNNNNRILSAQYLVIFDSSPFYAKAPKQIYWNSHVSTDRRGMPNSFNTTIWRALMDREIREKLLQ